jgi:hypothetical protein
MFVFRSESGVHQPNSKYKTRIHWKDFHTSFCHFSTYLISKVHAGSRAGPLRECKWEEWDGQGNGSVEEPTLNERVVFGSAKVSKPIVTIGGRGSVWSWRWAIWSWRWAVGGSRDAVGRLHSRSVPALCRSSILGRGGIVVCGRDGGVGVHGFWRGIARRVLCTYYGSLSSH